MGQLIGEACLIEKLVCASGEGFISNVSVVRDHYDRNGPMFFTKLANEVGAAHGSHAVIGNEEVGRDAVEMVQGVQGLDKKVHLRAWECLDEQSLDKEEHVRIVVGYCDM